MTYDVEFTPNAKSDLNKLDAKTARRVLKKLAWLADNLDTVGQKALTASFKGRFKQRCGDYRIIYGSNRQERKIVIHIVRHRSQAYKG